MVYHIFPNFKAKSYQDQLECFLQSDNFVQKILPFHENTYIIVLNGKKRLVTCILIFSPECFQKLICPNSLPNYKILNRFKFKALAYEKINVLEKFNLFWEGKNTF